MLRPAGSAVARTSGPERAPGTEDRVLTKAAPLKVTLLALAAALSAPAAATCDAQTSARRAGARQAAPSAILFVVGGEAESKEVTLDALAVVEGGRIRLPYAEQEGDGAKEFAAAHMKAGQKYRLTFGGGDAGTVTVRESIEGCNNYHGKGTAETTAPMRGRVMGLATSSETMGRRAASRRAPEAAEREAVLKLARNIYRQRRTPAPSVAAMEVTNLTATDLDGDGRFELVGSFVVAKGKARRDLFLIAAPQGASFRADFVNFQSYQLPPEGFSSHVDFVDQLDLDGDGQGEVVTINGGFDAYSYSVYRKQRGRWRLVHTFFGDAC